MGLYNEEAQTPPKIIKMQAVSIPITQSLVYSNLHWTPTWTKPLLGLRLQTHPTSPLCLVPAFLPGGAASTRPLAASPFRITSPYPAHTSDSTLATPGHTMRGGGCCSSTLPLSIKPGIPNISNHGPNETWTQTASLPASGPEHAYSRTLKVG